jgi:REP element-mobilizing transposase RayT
LCGFDPVSGKDHEHRKSWVRERLRKLASIFGIEVCGYAVMSNHLHVVLRVRPDLVDTWTDEEIALRWLRLYPPRDSATSRALEVEERHMNVITANPSRIAQLRQRLVSLSWFMRCLNEPIARAANQEDECTGRFWEGRFKSQALLDEAAILACSVYVDLNPIRAGVAETPEESSFTSAFDRIRSHQSKDPDSANLHPSTTGSDNPARREPVGFRSADQQAPPDAWLCELTLHEGASQFEQAGGIPAAVNRANPAEARTGRGSASRSRRPHSNLAARASDQGYLPVELAKYLSLLDWTGREIRAGKRGVIPSQLSPILDRLGVNGERWIETVQQFGRLFKRAAGRVDSLAAGAVHSGQRWFQGQCAARLAFR